MTAKEYLTQLKNLDNLLHALEEELHTAEIMAASIGASGSDGTASRSGNISDKTAHTAIKLTELKSEIQDTLDRYISIKLNATRIINMMADTQGATVFYHYYLHNLTLEETAEKMNRTYQNIVAIRNRAFKEFEQLMQKQQITD